MHPGQIRHLVDRAVHVAQASRSVTCIIVPADIQEEPFEEPPREHGVVYSSARGHLSPRLIPAETEIQKAAESLNSSERVGILIRPGAARAADEGSGAAELRGRVVDKAL